MPRENKLIRFYRDILPVAGMTTDEDDFIVVAGGKRKRKVTINHLPLVLPTRKHLKTMVAEDTAGQVKPIKVVFHPLKEDVVKGEGPVLRHYKKALAANISGILGEVILGLVKVAASTAKQKGASNKLFVDFITSLTDVTTKKADVVADVKTYDNILHLFNNGMEKHGGKFLIHFFLKKGGVIGDEKFNKVCVVSFPLYKQLKETKDRVIEGVKLRIKDVRLLTKIFEYIFPDIDENGKLYFGYNHPTGSGLLAMLKAMTYIGSRINEIIDSMEGQMEVGVDRIPMDWVEQFEHIEDLQKDIMAIAIVDKDSVTDKKLKPKKPAIPTETEATTPPPVAQPQPQVSQPEVRQPQVSQSVGKLQPKKKVAKASTTSDKIPASELLRNMGYGHNVPQPQGLPMQQPAAPWHANYQYQAPQPIGYQQQPYAGYGQARPLMPKVNVPWKR